jgi:type IV fimbrial biogenesis protein FimT
MMKTRAAAAGTMIGRRAYAGGLTMIELMVALVVLAILVTIAVPSFRNASLGSRLSASANDLLASVQLARSEAIKRNQTITICASSDGATCAASGGWEQGWIIVDAAAVVIQRQQGLPDGYLVSQSGGTSALSFQPIGIGATAATFTICRDDPLGSQERVLSLTASGAAFVTTTTTGACS